MVEMSDVASIHEEALGWYQANWDPAMAVGEWWDRLADAGWAFPSWPRGLGGRGLSGSQAKAAHQARLESGASGAPSGIATFVAAPTI